LSYTNTNTTNIIIKTFTSRESDFLREQFIKETKKREDFSMKIATWKKPRNPTTGELTSREDADYLMPINTSFQNDIDFKKELNDFSSDRDEPRIEFASFYSGYFYSFLLILIILINYYYY